MVTFFFHSVVLLQAYDQNEIPFNYLRQNSLNQRINESKRLNGQTANDGVQQQLSWKRIVQGKIPSSTKSVYKA